MARLAWWWLPIALLLLLLLLATSRFASSSSPVLELGSSSESAIQDDEQHASPDDAQDSSDDDNDVCFVGTISGQLHAMHSQTGRVLWSADLGGTRVQSFQAPDARSHGFIVPGEDGSLFSMIDGSLYQYPFSVADFVAQSPLFHDNGVHTQSIFASKFETVYHVDRATGRVLGSVGFNSPSAAETDAAAAAALNTATSTTSTATAFLTVIRHEYRVRAFDQLTHRELWNLTFAEFTSPAVEDEEAVGGAVASSSPPLLSDSLLKRASQRWKSPVALLASGTGSSLKPKVPAAAAALNQLVLGDGRVQWYVGRRQYSGGDKALPAQPQQQQQQALVPVTSFPAGAVDEATLEVLLLQQHRPVLRYDQGEFVSHSSQAQGVNRTLDAAAAPPPPQQQQQQQQQLPAELYLLAITIFTTVVALALIAKLQLQQPLISLPPSSLSPASSAAPLTADPSAPVLSSPAATAEENLGRIKVFSDKIKGYGCNGTIVLEGRFENRSVAVKRMQRALCGSDKSAVKEINFLIQSEGHPNVVRYFAREETPDFLFLALELCDMTLEQAMRDSAPPQAFNQPYLTDSTRHFLAQLASATRHLHQLGIVHCDIKAQNVLVCRRGSKHTATAVAAAASLFWQQWTPKLSDMGLSRRVETSSVAPMSSSHAAMFAHASSHAASPSSTAHTNHVLGLGTVGWRAPELLGTAKTPISRSLDMFALGCLFFYVLHGTHPFGTDLLSLETQIVKGDAVELKQNGAVLPETRSIVQQMIAPTATARLSSLAVLHDPFLLPGKSRLEFVCLVSNRLEREDPNSPLMRSFEGMGPRVFHRTSNWANRLDNDTLRQDVLSNKKRKYDLASLRDLLRYIRNKHHHFDEDPHLARVLSPDPDEFLRVFTVGFPQLMPLLTQWVFTSGVAREEKFAAMLGGEPVYKERGSEDAVGGEGADGAAAAAALSPIVYETERKWFPRGVVWEPPQCAPLAQPPASNFKTNLCLHYEREQRCAMGTKCGFAHGRLELRRGGPGDNNTVALVLPQNEADVRKYQKATTPQKKRRVVVNTGGA